MDGEKETSKVGEGSHITVLYASGSAKIVRMISVQGIGLSNWAREADTREVESAKLTHRSGFGSVVFWARHSLGSIPLIWKHHLGSG